MIATYRKKPLPPQVIKFFYVVEGSYKFLPEFDTSTTVPGVTSQTTVFLIFAAMTMCNLTVISF